MSTAPQTQLQQQPPQPPSQPDWFLQSLVEMVNHSELEIGITLQISGFLVSGGLVGGAKYFEGFASDFVSGLDSNSKEIESIKQMLAKHGDVYKTTENEDESVPPLPMYIHIKQAKFFNTNGNPIPANRGVWWRGRISEVSGFVLGTLSNS